MLTAAQIEARRGKLTASRVAPLMTGDVAAIMRLYHELRGEAEPEDLSGVWAVQLGSVTELLQMDWFERKNHIPVTRRGKVVVHPDLEWAACTLDGWVEDVQPYPIEAKHTGGHEPFEVLYDRYAPQLHWTLFVTGAKQIAVSVIMGAAEPFVEYVERGPDNEKYIEELLTRAQQFMHCVQIGEPPVRLAPVLPPVDPQRIYNFSTDNMWVDQAKEWLSTKPLSDRCREAEKVLKSKVPEDAVRAFGGGVRISRDRVGRLSLRAGDFV